MKNRIFIFFFLLCILTNILQSENDQYALKIYMPGSYSNKIAQQIEKSFENITNKLTLLFKFKMNRTVHLVVCKNHKNLEKFVNNKLPKWLFGIALTKQYTIAINGEKISVPYNTLSSVVKHETCHIFLGYWEQLYKKTFPLWFNEGICEWCSGAIHFSYQSRVLDTVVFERNIPFKFLESHFPRDAGLVRQAYLQSLSVINYLTIRYGKDCLKKILKSFKQQNNSFNIAMVKALGINTDQLQTQWEASIKPKEYIAWLWKFTKIFSLFGIITILALIAFWRQRVRRKKILEEMEEDELEFDID